MPLSCRERKGPGIYFLSLYSPHRVCQDRREGDTDHYVGAVMLHLMPAITVWMASLALGHSSDLWNIDNSSNCLRELSQSYRRQFNKGSENTFLLGSVCRITPHRVNKDSKTSFVSLCPTCTQWKPASSSRLSGVFPFGHVSE